MRREGMRRKEKEGERRRKKEKEEDWKMRNGRIKKTGRGEKEDYKNK